MSKTAIRSLFVLTILSVFLFTGSAILFAENVHAARTGRVNTASVNVRSGPATTYNKLGTVKKGMKLEILEQKAGWYKVKIWKIDGWIKSELISTKGKVPEGKDTKPDNGSGGSDTGANDGNDSAGKYLVIQKSSVNVRSGAGTNYSVVLKANAADKYEVVQRQGDWYKITLPDGKQGWVAGWVVKVMEGPMPSRGDTGSTRPDSPDNGTGTTPGQDQGNAGTGNSGSSGGQEPDDNGNIAVVELANVDYNISEQDKEKIVISGSGPLQYSVASLADPPRLVIDIKNCDVNGLKDLEANGNLLQKVRISQYSLFPMAVRIVLDLNKKADFVPFISEDGASLRITLSEPNISGKVIVIDPGHGGWDNGATGATGLKEKEVNLDTALKLRDKLTALGATVIMTREDDTFISLTERSRIANDAKADVFVSVHANANTNPAIKGTSNYFYAGNALSTQFAQREKLAKLVQNNMVALMGTRDIGILQENFAVLRGTNMPSILVESAFLSNAGDEALLKEDDFRDRAAQGIANGLTEYFTGEK